MTDPVDRMQHMVRAIEAIQRHQGRGRAALDEDELFRGFVLHNLQIVGEAAYQIPKCIRDDHASVPWQEIIGTRHVLVHGYTQVDLDIIWSIIERDLKPLKKGIETILASSGNVSRDLPR